MRASWCLVLLCAVACRNDDEPSDIPALDATAPDSAIDSVVGAPDARMAGGSVDATVSMFDAGANGMAASPGPTFLYFVPQDQASAATEAGLGLSVYSFEPGRAPAEILRELADALELVRWPSAEELPAQVRFDANKPAYTQQVTLEPNETLSEGDYALRLNPTPARVRLGAIGSEQIGEIATSRFHVGSRPIVTRIELCEKAGAKTKLLAEFSELVRASTSTAPSVEVLAGATALPCEPPSLPGSGVETVCSFLPLPPSVRVSFAGFEGLSGVALRNEAGGEPDYTFSPAALPELEQGCKVYVPWRAIP